MAEGNCPIASRSSFRTAITIRLNLAVLTPVPLQAFTSFVNCLCTRASDFVAIWTRDRPKLKGRSQGHNQPCEHNPAWIRHRRPTFDTMMANGRHARPPDPGSGISSPRSPRGGGWRPSSGRGLVCPCGSCGDAGRSAPLPVAPEVASSPAHGVRVRFLQLPSARECVRCCSDKNRWSRWQAALLVESMVDVRWTATQVPSGTTVLSCRKIPEGSPSPWSPE